MSTRHGFYDVALDGGSVGVHLLRVGFIRPHDLIVVKIAVATATFTFAAGATFDLGWVSDPAGFASGIDPAFFGPPPEVEAQSYVPTIPNLGGWESMVIRVNGADLTAGVLEVIIEVSFY